MARYECSVCGFIYDEEEAGTSWQALADDWECPLCGAEKSAFETLAEDGPPTDQNVSASGEAADSVEESAAAERIAPAARNTPVEPTVEFIHSLACDGLEKIGPHGLMGAMGVPGSTLPQWDDIQILPAQLARKPLAEDVEVDTSVVIGPNARKPLQLKIPLFVSDMSFGALSEEAKIALAKGAEMAGTGIASGEGGMLPEEQAANPRYLFELGSGRFGYSEEVMTRVQAFHFKAGQAAKTGIGGHLPGSKVRGKIATIRKLAEGTPAISPPTFADLTTPADYEQFGDRVRELTGGIPIGMKLSAQHIEEDIQFALQAGVDYIILDGRGGATGASPLIFRDHISVPTIPALARARRILDQSGRSGVTLVITGGLRTPADFVKALCLGADAIAVANAALQAIGCVAARICHTNNCPHRYCHAAGASPRPAERRSVRRPPGPVSVSFRGAYVSGGPGLWPSDAEPVQCRTTSPPGNERWLNSPESIMQVPAGHAKTSNQRSALAAQRYSVTRAEEDERQNGKSKLGHQMKGTPPEGSHGSWPLQCVW